MTANTKGYSKGYNAGKRYHQKKICELNKELRRLRKLEEAANQESPIPEIKPRETGEITVITRGVDEPELAELPPPPLPIEEEKTPDTSTPLNREEVIYMQCLTSLLTSARQWSRKGEAITTAEEYCRLAREFQAAVIRQLRNVAR